jgi:hypothetical protein
MLVAMHTMCWALAISKNGLVMTMLVHVGEATTPPCLTSMNDFMSRLKNISSPNICIHVHFFKSPYAPNWSFDKIMELKSRSQSILFKTTGSSKVYLFKMSNGSLRFGVVWLGRCILEVIFNMFGWCLTIHIEWKVGLQRHVTFMTLSFVMWWLLLFSTCCLRMQS